MVKRVVIRITSTLRQRRNTYKGTVRILGLDNHMIRPNVLCITRYGVGRILEKFEGNDVIAVDVNKTRRLLNKRDLYYFAVYQEKLGKFLAVNGSDYHYLINGNQRIEFRITRKGHAVLTDKTKNEYKAYALLQKTKNGRQLLQSLLEKGYKIIH